MKMGLKSGKSPNSYLYVPAAFTGLSLSGGINSMIQTTTSYTQQSEQTFRSPENEHYLPGIITCTICGADYALASAHQSLLQATVLEAAFMSMCHFWLRWRV